MTIRVLKPWLRHRPRHRVCDTIVLHATAGSTLAGAIDTLRERKLSYHYLIDKNGEITKCAPAGAVAFHAGESVGPSGGACNEYSIGVSFVNLNDGKDPYTTEQHLAARELVAELKVAIPSIRWITTHYWISPKRKTDPRGYPVEELAQFAGLKIWAP